MTNNVKLKTVDESDNPIIQDIMKDCTIEMWDGFNMEVVGGIGYENEDGNVFSYGTLLIDILIDGYHQGNIDPYDVLKKHKIMLDNYFKEIGGYEP